MSSKMLIATQVEKEWPWEAEVEIPGAALQLTRCVILGPDPP